MLKGVAPVVTPPLVLKSRKTDNFPRTSSSEMRPAALLRKVSMRDRHHIAACINRYVGKKSLELIEPGFQANIDLVIANPRINRVLAWEILPPPPPIYNCFVKLEDPASVRIPNSLLNMKQEKGGHITQDNPGGVALPLRYCISCVDCRLC